MADIVILLAAILPTAAYVGLIYWADRYEKEPIWLLSATFLWGAVPSIFVAIVLNELLSIPFTSLLDESLVDVASAAIVAPLVEETAKGAALLAIFFYRKRDIDSLLDGIIYGAMVGLGFAMVENFLYFEGEYASGGYQALGINVFFRAFLFGLNHALFSAACGLGVAYARLNRSELRRLLAPPAGWAVAVTLHALHNATVGLGNALCLLAPLSDWGGVILTGLIVAWALRQEQQWLTEYLKEEVVMGTITFRQYELVSDWAAQRMQFADMMSHWQFGRIRRTRHFLNLCAKLASQKHHAELHPEDEHVEIIQDLRKQIHELSLQL